MSNNLFGIFNVISKSINNPTRNTKLIDYSSNIMALLFGTSIHVVYVLSTEKKEDIQVINKYKFVKYGSTQFMIVDQKGRYFNVNTSLWYWKWDSIEDWSQIKKDTPLSVKYYGWRMPTFGLFPNIVKSNYTENVLCSHCKMN